jgi:hypothetical protein
MGQLGGLRQSCQTASNTQPRQHNRVTCSTFFGSADRFYRPSSASLGHYG